jgi:hypothetical protein
MSEEYLKKMRKKGFSDYSILMGECHPENQVRNKQTTEK